MLRHGITNRLQKVNEDKLVSSVSGILTGTGHYTDGRMFIDGRWAPQIGNWLMRRFFLHAELHSKVSGILGLVLVA